MIVSDTNLLAHFWLNGTESNVAVKVRKSDPEWVAPGLWIGEFRNTLALYHRKNLLSYSRALQVIKHAEHMMYGRIYNPESIHVLELVNNSECSAYDCEFVAVAQDLKVPFLTFDKKVLREFPEIAVHPKEFLEQR